MIVSNIQNVSIKNSYTSLNKISKYPNNQLSQDKVSFSGNNNAQHNQVYNIVKQAREGNEESIGLMAKAMDLDKKTGGDWSRIFSSLESKVVKEIAKYLSLFDCNYSEFDVYNYPRIYRIIGNSEYDPLMKGKQISSELRSYCKGVDVTNNLHYGSACTEGDKAYLITFKLKDNLDAFLSQLPGPHQNGNSRVDLKNKRSSEFILQGGYNIDDVENITEYSADFPDGKMIYGNPTKKIKIELENEKKQIKPQAEISDAKIVTPIVDDGINDIGNIGAKPSKSDLEGATDGLSIQGFLKKETEALTQQNIDLREIEIPKIDIPDVPDLGLEDLNLSDDVDKISKDIDKLTKSSKTFKPVFLLLGIGASIAGAIYYISKKNKKYNQGLDKKV